MLSFTHHLRQKVNAEEEVKITGDEVVLGISYFENDKPETRNGALAKIGEARNQTNLRFDHDVIIDDTKTDKAIWDKNLEPWRNQVKPSL